MARAFLEPLCYLFSGLAYRQTCEIQQGHRWVSAAGVFLEQVGEVEHVGDEWLVTGMTPGGTVTQALGKFFVGADEGEIVDVSEIAAVGAGFQLIGQCGAEEEDGMPALVDGDSQVKPDVPVASVIVRSRGGDMAPEDVAVQADVLGQLWREFDGEGRFADAAGAGDDEEGKLAKRMFVAAVGADGVRPGAFYGLLV